MRAAPEMSPTLDDALRALDGFPGRPADVATARRFLEQLDDVRDVPAVVLDRAQAERMEGAYLAGVRCVDESGHVLVMSLPAFLQLCPPPVPPQRLSVWGRLLPCSLPFAGLCAAASLGAALQGQSSAALAWLLAAAGFVLAWNEQTDTPTACTYDCNSGRACTCVPNQNKRT